MRLIIYEISFIETQVILDEDASASQTHFLRNFPNIVRLVIKPDNDLSLFLSSNFKSA